MSESFLAELRRRELAAVIALEGAAVAGRDVLEIGSGQGTQLALLRRSARLAVGVDVEAAPDARGVALYDGRRLPFADRSFDLVFSSNVLEHVSDLSALDAEIRRVLRDDGLAAHVLPSHSWRLWTSLAHYPALPATALRVLRRRGGGLAGAGRGRRRRPLSLLLDVLVAPRHGEAGSRFDEWRRFRPAAWRATFGRFGWRLVEARPAGLFYTGYSLLDRRLPIAARERLAGWLGSSCWIFTMRKA